MLSRIFRFSLLILAGILIAWICPRQSSFIAIPAALLILSWFGGHFFRYRLSGLFILSSIILTGFLHLQIRQWSSERKLQAEVFEIKLIGPLAGGWKGEIKGHCSDGQWRHANLNVLVYGLTDREHLTGQHVIISASMEQLQSQGFRRFLSDRHIYYVLNAKVFRIVPERSSMLRSLRRQLSTRISRILTDPGQFALMEAILLGDKTGLSGETKINFQRTGGMHVLAVSGLHVSILYMILRLFLSFLPNYIIFRWLNFIVTSVVMILYAGITGFTPSVNRAVLFFLLFGVGELAGRKPQLIHILPSTACLVWMIDPLQVFSLSFQFSYAAVCGIMLFQPVFERRLSGLHPILAYVFRMITVSVSAQAFTWPLAAIYFGGISPVGIVFSVLLVPAVFILLCLCLASMALLDFDIPGRVLTYLFEALLREVENMVAALAQFPWSYSETDLSVSIVISVFVLTLLVYLLFTQPSRNSLSGVLIGILCVYALLIASNGRHIVFLNVSDVNIIRLEEAGGHAKMKSRKIGIEKYPLQLIKFGNVRILATRSIVPFNPVDAIIILKGSQPPDKFIGKPVLIFSNGLSEFERRRWINSARQSGLDYFDAGWDDIAIKK